MTKAEFIAKVSEKTGLTKKDTDATVTAVLEVITETVAAGDKVAFPGFGTFESVEKAARTARNPKTGETMTVDAKTAPKFKAGKGFKEAVNK